MKQHFIRYIISVIFLCISGICAAQNYEFSGMVMSENGPVEMATIRLKGTNYITVTGISGHFVIRDIPQGAYTLNITCIGFDSLVSLVAVDGNATPNRVFNLKTNQSILNTVIVTGVSKATLIRENPMAVTGISAKAIQQTIQSNIIDVLVQHTPGLNAVKTGPNISKPFIRGLGYNRVLTLYDGMRQEGQQWGDEHGIEVDEYNIQKAEVIKGPASLMYGSDALAGVVSLFPNVPAETNAKLHGSVTTEYQTNNNLIGDGFNIGYNNGQWLYGAAGSFRLAKNYRNNVDGRVYNTGFSEKNASAFAGYKSAKGSTLINFTLYDNLQGIPDGSRDSLTRRFTKQVLEGDMDNLKNRPVVSGAELNSYTLSPLHQRIQHYRVYTNSVYGLGGGSIHFLLGFQQNIRREYNHPTEPAQPGLYVRLNTVNYGVRYSAPSFNNIELSAGINGMVQNNASKNATDFPIPDYSLFDGGAYGFAKWKYHALTVSGGVRYDVRKVHWNDFYVAATGADGFNRHITGTDTSGAALQFAAFKKTFTGLSASIGFTYALTRQVSIKSNISRGYRAPNITEMASNGLDPGAHIIYLGNRNFNPEFSVQEDIGAIASYRDIDASLSFFNNNLQNYIYLSLLLDGSGSPLTDAQGNKTYQYEQSSAQLYGLEATFALHPAKWTGFNFSNNLAVIYGFNRGVSFKNKGNNGEYLPLMPPLKLQSILSQKINFEAGIISSLQPQIEYEFNAAQNRYLSLNNTETFTPAYTLLNIGLVSEVKYSNTNTISVQLQVNNLFNTAYQSGISRLKYFEYYTQSPIGHLGIYNMGRNISLRVIIPF